MKSQQIDVAKVSIKRLTIPLMILMTLSLTSSSFAYNWVWDQGHDRTNIGEDDTSDTNDQQCEECAVCELCNVYTLTGGYFEKVTDITLTGIGPILSVRRTWNSTDPASTLLGNGWTFNLGRNIVPLKGKDGQEYLVVRRSNGQELKLLRSGNYYSFTTDIRYSFDIEKTANGWLLTEKDGSTARYNDEGKIVSITDRNGLSIIFTYSTVSGCLERATNASGNYLDFTLNPNGKLETVSDNLGRTVTYGYDANGNLMTVSYWDGSSITYSYNAANLLINLTNRRGQIFRYIAYNQSRKVIQIQERGETFTFTYDSENRTGTKTDSQGRQWITVADEFGNNIQVTNPLGNTKRLQPGSTTGGRGYDWKEDENGNRTTFNWDANGNMTARTDPLGNTEYWSYNANNDVTTYTDASGVVTNYFYDSEGNLIRIVEAAGTDIERELNYIYDDNGNMLTETDPAGATTTWEYDGQGNKTKQTGPLGEEITWTYDNLNRMTSMTNPLGHTWTYTYDEQGNQLTETDPLGNVTTREYDVDDNLVAEIDALGNRTEYLYDAWDRLTKRIGPLQDTTIQQYVTIADESYVSAIRDAEMHWIFYQYDGGGRKTSEIVKMNDDSPTPDSDDLVTSFTYDAAGNLLKITNPVGDTTGFVYDNNNQRIILCNGEGECTENEYDSEGRISQITQPNGNVIVYEYDELGQLVRISDNLGILNEKQYDIAGNVAWDRTPGRGAMMYEYDQTGRVVHQMDSTGVGNRFTYDAAGRVRTSTDSLHNTTERGYDGLGRLIWTRNALGDTVKNQYNANGNQTALIDPDGNTTTFAFDAAGRTVATVYPDNGIDSTNYNKVGWILQKKNPNGTYTNFAYNDAGRLLSKIYSDGATPEDHYTYDKNGRMLTANNSVAQLTWQYDNVSRPTSYQQVVDGQTDVLQYGYDMANGVLSLTYPDGKVVQRKMDQRNRLDSVVVDGNIVAADYDYIGIVMSTKTLGNGIVANYEYDKTGRLTRLAYTGGTSALPDFSYGYDMAGNMRYAMKNHQPDMSETYEYDAISQLVRWRRGELTLNDTTVHSPNYYQEWVLDSRGNWQQFNDNGTVQNRAHNTVNELTDIDGTTYVYNNNGNMLSNGAQSYIWNARNLIEEVNGNKYLYDALGRRISVEYNNGKKAYIFFEKWNELLEISTDKGIETRILGESIDDAITIFSKDSIYYPLVNIQKSTTCLTNTSLDISENYDYFPYGAFKAFTRDGNTVPTSSIKTQYMYTGRKFDEESGIYYFRWRMYDANLGIFLQRDPIGYVDGYNLYKNYFNVNGLDPYGMAISHARCLTAVSVGQRRNARIRRYIQNINNTAGCTSPSVSCNCCSYGGLFDPNTGNIEICENNVNTEGEVIIVLAHEYNHAWDHCQNQLNNCNQIACSEIRSYNISGQCNPGSGWRLPSESYRACVRRLAILSVSSITSCQANAAQYVSNNMNACF